MEDNKVKSECVVDRQVQDKKVRESGQL